MIAIIAPENTIAAANKAFETGAGLWETDIVAASNEQLILFHDNSLLRTTNTVMITVFYYINFRMEGEKKCLKKVSHY